MTAAVDTLPVAAHAVSFLCPVPCSHGRCRDLRIDHEYVQCAELSCSALIAVQAREFAGHVLCAWGCWELLDRVVRVVSELATNALLHGRVQGTAVARVYRDSWAVWFEIEDRCEAEPRVRLPGAEIDKKADGWGLFLVDCLTDRFGWHTAGGGKTVFARWALPISSLPPERADVHAGATDAPGTEAVES